ncbi:MAG: lysine transporter [Burkholderiales bacterium]|jgi:lysine-specific permease|nr:lysine transporter [Burkholderiales bacterium]
MLAKTLEARHLNMIALGGSIGTGIFLASGYVISVAGPGGALLAYLLIAIMVFFLITSLGELSTYRPSTGTFCEYSGDYVNKPFGYAMSINYWFNWSITIAAEISAAVIVMKFWFPHGSDLVFSSIFFFAILILNLFAVRVFGEVEYFMSMLKVLVIVIVIVLGTMLVLGQPKFGLNNFTIADAPFHDSWKGFFSVFLLAGFSFQGSELIGVASGEAKDPSKSIPRAVRNVFWRLILFYILATMVISLLIPFNDKRMASQDSVNASPFTLIFSHYIPGTIAANILNFVILVAILSAANASMYSATRTLWYMGHRGEAAKIFSKTTSYGLPIYALLATALVGSTVFVFSFIGNGVLFTRLVNVSSTCGFIAWFGIALSHYKFRKHYITDISKLSYRAIWFPFGPIFSMILIAVIILGQGYSLIESFSLSGLLDSYGAPVLFILLMVYYKAIRKNKEIIK